MSEPKPIGMKGCGHVWMPNSSGLVEQSTAICGECGRTLVMALQSMRFTCRTACEGIATQNIEEAVTLLRAAYAATDGLVEDPKLGE